MIRNKNADIIRAIKEKKCCKDVVLESLKVTENDTYTAEKGKAWNEVTVNVESGGGGGVFNIDDIILADDLLEKCRALEYGGSGRYRKCTTDTGWTFSDICIQDSCGVLQNAFENIVIDENDNLITKQVLVLRADGQEGGLYNSWNPNLPQGLQCIIVSETGFWYEIIYNPTTQKYEAYWCTDMM